MNALRLTSGVGTECFTQRTGLAENVLNARAKTARERGWLTEGESGRFATTPLGFQFLDSVVTTLL